MDKEAAFFAREVRPFIGMEMKVQLYVCAMGCSIT